MKYYKKLQVYKASNNVLDLINKKAWSYNWWLYMRQYTNSKGETLLVFNNTSYSPSTRRHQSKALRVITDNNITIDLMIYNTRASLENLELKDILEIQYEEMYFIMAENTVKRKPVSTEGLQNRIDILVSFIGQDLTNDEKQTIMNEAEARILSKLNNKYSDQAYKLLERDAKNTYVDIDGAEFILPIDKALELGLVDKWKLRHTFKDAHLSLNF